MGVVVHGRAEQVGAALVTERVVQDQRDLRGQPRQQEMEQPLTEGVEQVGISPDAVEVPRGVRAETISVRGVVAGSLGGEGGGRRP